MAVGRNCTLSFLALVGVFISSSAEAVVSEAVCAQARALAKTEKTLWFGLDASGKLTALKPTSNVDPKAAAKVIYLASRDSQGGDKTVVGVKIKFTPELNSGERDTVKVQNNFKSTSLTVTFADYQGYHRENKAQYDLNTNFHLSRGIFNREIPFSTFTPEERRRQMAFPPASGNQEVSYRAYLLTFKAIRPDGTCVDILPYYPPGAKSVDFEAVDLLEDRGSGRHYFAAIKIGLSE